MSREVFLVHIVEIDTDEVVKMVKTFSARIAAKIRDGMEINLNHDEYEVRISSYEE